MTIYPENEPSHSLLTRRNREGLKFESEQPVTHVAEKPPTELTKAAKIVIGIVVVLGLGLWFVRGDSQRTESGEHDYATFAVPEMPERQCEEFSNAMYRFAQRRDHGANEWGVRRAIKKSLPMPWFMDDVDGFSGRRERARSIAFRLYNSSLTPEEVRSSVEQDCKAVFASRAERRKPPGSKYSISDRDRKIVIEMMNRATRDR
ncbi:hypothetical protein [Vannielia litorea]|uniref:hypothetical protein n=1 Tax=Vannielia litorea TaxID=1217970 RepID=UPI00111520BC|nr:hypothetical protein [Vannielia litorea]